MKLETLGKNNKKKILIGGLIGVCLISVIAFTTTRAKYKSTQNLKIASGDIVFKESDLDLVAIKISEDGENYVSSNTVPTGAYEVNTEKSKCRIPTDTLKGENAPADNNVTIEYLEGKLNFRGLTTQNTKCYIYLNKLDTEIPVISNVSTSVTKNSITLTVSASDNKGVTEYYYQLGSNTPVSKTSNSHTFSGLSAGTSYTIKIYVKDAAGNQSDTTTKTVTTSPDIQSASTAFAGVKSSAKTTTPTFSNTATTDEGVYRTSDGMYGGYSYYWRGAATTNHVIFANKCWRIIRINGDGTIRLIYNGTIQSGNKCTGNEIKTTDSIAVSNQVYNSSYDRSEYVGYTYSLGSQRPVNTSSGTASNLKTQTELWYKNNITDIGYDGKVATGKFCNDRNIESGYSWSSRPSSKFRYAGYRRLYTDYTPTFSCSTNDIYSLKTGAITADEVQFAGGKENSNTSYYLYNGQNYWIMSPRYWSGTGAYATRVDSSGYLDGVRVENTLGIRPVINLKSDISFNGNADGTQDNPYIVQ